MHAAADTAKSKVWRKYQSEEEDKSTELAFAQDDSKLMNNYTNKVKLQSKYQNQSREQITDENQPATAINHETEDNLSDLDRHIQ